MKRATKIILLIIVVLMIGVGLWIVNSFAGNPLSKIMAKNAAENYIAEQYADRDFIIEDVFYNFKDGYYHANVASPSSIDTYFSIYVSGNKVNDDTYENDVLSGWNTYERIDREYRDMVDKVFLAENFPLISHIDFGTIELFDENTPTGFDEPHYGIEMGKLELDKQYDVRKLAETAGHIIYYAQDDDVSFEKAAQLMLTLKDSLDEADIPFYALDFVLEKPRDKDGVAIEDSESIHTVNFLYEHIYEEGLVERIEEAHDALMKYYDEQDAKMKD